jgi:hypothetical protein
MATFSPPTDNFVYWSEPGEQGIMAFLKPGRRGRNVYKLKDGSYTEWQPDHDDIAYIYHGGHVHPLTAQEEADLTAAGYGDYIEA